MYRKRCSQVVRDYSGSSIYTPWWLYVYTWAGFLRMHEQDKEGRGEKVGREGDGLWVGRTREGGGRVLMLMSLL